MQVDCEGCGAVLRLKEEFIGRRVKCPKCGTSQLVPEPALERSPYDDDPLFTIDTGPTPPPVHQSLRPSMEQPPLPAYQTGPTAPRPPVLNSNHPAANPPQPVYSPTGYYPDGAGRPNVGSGNQAPISPGYAPPSYSNYGSSNQGSVPSSHAGFPIASPPVINPGPVAGVGAQANMASGPWGASQTQASSATYMEMPSPPAKTWSISPGKIALGLLMMLGAVVWFVLGLAADKIFFYPPILFLFGIGSVIKGFLGHSE